METQNPPLQLNDYLIHKQHGYIIKLTYKSRILNYWLFEVCTRLPELKYPIREAYYRLMKDGDEHLLHKNNWYVYSKATLKNKFNLLNRNTTEVLFGNK